MIGFVASQNFTGWFSSLNGLARLTATRPDIFRSLLTVGYPSRRYTVRTLGKWRERMLVAMATGYLDLSLRTTPYFRNLEQTEKGGITFLFGEAFTHWYAQSLMNVPYLLHVAGLISCQWGTAAAPAIPKAGAFPPLAKSRPDFIGISRNERHVFESKGRSRAPSAGVIAKALGQVSALQTINGRAPTTRVATFFMLKASGPEGRVIDPVGEECSVTVSFDEHDALSRAYAFFLDQPVSSLTEKVGPVYVGREIDDGVFFGVDKDVLAAIRERPQTKELRTKRVDEIFSILESRSVSYALRRETGVSSGLDGTILLDNRKPAPPKRLRPRG